MTKQELDKVLERHSKYLRGEAGGVKANLSNANLSRANLYNANLYNANLSGANLSRANLSNANLSGANLSGADLSRADLSHANLSGADLSGADLSHANLVLFQYNRHAAYFTFNGTIRIGCHYHKISDWIKNYKSVGKKENYTKDEVYAYGVFIKLCDKLQKSKKVTK